MRDYTINQLAQMLSANIGNRLTNELATGLLTTLNQVLSEKETKDTPQAEG